MLFYPFIYNFSGTTVNDYEFWSDIVDIQITNFIDNQNNTQKTLSVDSKINILSKEIETITKTIESSYIMEEGESPKVTFSTRGGKEPILIRNIHPNYTLLNNGKGNSVCNSIVIED